MFLRLVPKTQRPAEPILYTFGAGNNNAISVQREQEKKAQALELYVELSDYYDVRRSSGFVPRPRKAPRSDKRKPRSKARANAAQPDTSDVRRMLSVERYRASARYMRKQVNAERQRMTDEEEMIVTAWLEHIQWEQPESPRCHKLTPEIAAKIREEGTKMKIRYGKRGINVILAQRYGVSESTISRVRNYKRWTNTSQREEDPEW